MHVTTALVSSLLSLAVLATATPSPLLFGGGGDSTTGPNGGGSGAALPKYPPGNGNATWEGKTKCTIPLPQKGFNPSKYVGTLEKPAVWYQLASQFQFFEVGCTCVNAKYGLFPNGTVSVENFCLRNGSPSTVKGTATPTPQFGTGSFVVSFGQPAGECGANYIVSKYYTDSKGAYTAAIVGAADFDGWFLLSKARIVGPTAIGAYLKDVAALGYDLSKRYSITQQDTKCPNSP
ncbi:hypothetical protein V8E36_003759 [Tilletia maclaganii]